jgi:uncharacterized repeat protein (TIGR04042 family)
MPEMLFQIRWPDGTRETCYSPSTIVKDYLVAERSYALHDFLAISRAALSAASDRVHAKYGVPCNRALSQIRRLETAGAAFSDTADALVVIESLQD